MKIPYAEFAERAAKIEQLIKEICRAQGRSPAEVTLMAVTKTHPVEAAHYAFRYGIKCVGESKVQEGVDKISAAIFPIRWELIGHLQSNKAALAARYFHRIQSIDSEKLLNRLNQICSREEKKMPILLQVNAGEDQAKFGISPQQAPRLLETALTCSCLQVEGLMTIGPLSSDVEIARRTFSRLRLLRDELEADFGIPLPELSMGMTGDLREAIEEGSTCVRVGTALFGTRNGKEAVS